MSQQESNRSTSTSASYSHNDKCEKGHLLEHKGRVPRQPMPKPTEEFFTRDLRLGQGSVTARRQKDAADPSREERAGAAMLRQTSHERLNPPSSGEKRKDKHGLQQEKRASNRRRDGPKGSPHVVDMSHKDSVFNRFVSNGRNVHTVQWYEIR